MEKILFCHNVVGTIRFLVPQTKVSEVKRRGNCNGWNSRRHGRNSRRHWDQYVSVHNFSAKVICVQIVSSNCSANVSTISVFCFISSISGQGPREPSGLSTTRTPMYINYVWTCWIAERYRSLADPEYQQQALSTTRPKSMRSIYERPCAIVG